MIPGHSPFCWAPPEPAAEGAPPAAIVLSAHTQPDAAYRAAGREVVMIPSLPERARPQDVEQAMQANLRAVPEAAGNDDPLAGKHWARRWWRYRRVHRMFGWKFWCIVCGAAPLDPALEAFWRKLGFLVVQGYGLTETAPIISVSNPFARRRGSVGKPMGGQETRIGPDGLPLRVFPRED